MDERLKVKSCLISKIQTVLCVLFLVWSEKAEKYLHRKRFVAYGVNWDLKFEKKSFSNLKQITENGKTWIWKVALNFFFQFYVFYFMLKFCFLVWQFFQFQYYFSVHFFQFQTFYFRLKIAFKFGFFFSVLILFFSSFFSDSNLFVFQFQKNSFCPNLMAPI